MKRLTHPSPRSVYKLAASLWLIAGANVLRIGLDAWRTTGSTLWVILWLVASLGFFAGFIFPRVVRRNMTFIQSLPTERLRPWHCFSPSSWAIMVGMITLGVTIRQLGLLPDTFIAGFYSGLGASLMLAITPYLQQIRTSKP